MGVVAWILVGAVAGWFSELIVKDAGPGLLTNMIIGIIGAFIGGFIMNLVGNVGVTGFTLWNLLVSTLGAGLLLAAAGLLRRKAT